MAIPDQCALCGSSSASLTVTTSRVFGDRQGGRAFFECENCGIHFQFPRLTADEELEFYSKEFEAFMAQRAGSGAGWKSPVEHVNANEATRVRRMQFLEPYLPPRSSILEVGSSSGFMLYPLIAQGHRCVGVEPSGVFSSFSSEHGLEVYQSLDDVEQVFDSEAFDLVMHFFVFEHLANPKDQITRHLRLLKKGGTVVFEVPNSFDPLSVLFDFPAFERFYWSVAHHWYWNEKSLKWLLGGMGLQFHLIREQRYDLSNHFVWAHEGRPGGQGRFREVFGPDLEAAYARRLKDIGLCDTLFVVIEKD